MAEWRKKVHLGIEDITEKKFGELVDWYLKLPGTKAKRSYKKDVERGKVLKEYFGVYPARLIKPAMLEEFQQKMLTTLSSYSTAYRPATVNRMLALMKRIYNLAIREDFIDKNPCWKVTMLAEENKRNRILSFEELDHLVRELKPYVVPIVLTSFYTGMRLKEILDLIWDRVNLREGWIDLEANDTKTGDPRRIYFVSEELWNILRKTAKVRSLENNYVFTFRGKKIENIHDSIRNGCRRAGIENFVFHDLRHTFNTNMRKGGVERSVIMRMTGHKTESMLHRYNTIDYHDIEEAVRKRKEFVAVETRDYVNTTSTPRQIQETEKNRGRVVTLTHLN